MIPQFDDDRIKFVKFIQKNQDVFDELLESGRYNLTRDTKYIDKVYDFFKNFDLSDDANVYSLQYDLGDFDTDGEPEIETIKDNFNKWLERDKVKEYFEKEYNKKIQREEKKMKTLHSKVFNQIEEIGTKRRTMKRTSKIKDELSDIDYVPDDREKSVKGKTYRSVRDKFNTRNRKKNIGGMKRKTKNRHLK